MPLAALSASDSSELRKAQHRQAARLHAQQPQGSGQEHTEEHQRPPAAAQLAAIIISSTESTKGHRDQAGP